MSTGHAPCLYRVNCGGDTRYCDAAGHMWLPDQEWLDGRAWGVCGGATSLREPALPVHNRVRPALLASQGRIPAPMARYLARVAWETVQSYQDDRPR